MFTKIEKRILLEWVRAARQCDLESLDCGMKIYEGKFSKKELKNIYASIRRKIKSPAAEIDTEDFEIFERMDGITTDLH